MKVYAGIDLHSSNSYVAVVDEQGRQVTTARVKNVLGNIVAALSGYVEDLGGVAVESTYNWYWLVDGLRDEGFDVRLANPAAIQKYKGLKHIGDRHDACWLADMLRLGVLPEGYIYPKEERPVRDLLRTRSILVRRRTSLITSLSNIVTRNTGERLRSNDIKTVRENRIQPLLANDRNLLASGDALKEVIDCIGRRITKIEREIVAQVALQPAYEHLLSLPGVGKVLGLTIMLETGPINRFAGVGNYASYCRKVSSEWVSNDKIKGKGNVKNGNRYLAWAFGEAAEHARRHDERARAYYNRKMRKTNAAVAHAALAHKLARAAYHVMKNEEPFTPDRMFG